MEQIKRKYTVGIQICLCDGVEIWTVCRCSLAADRAETFRETIKLKGWWAKNVALYLLGVLPPLLTVGLFWVIYPYFKAVEKQKEKYANVVHAK